MKFWTTIRQDLIAGLVVFFVALPLCLGIAFASGAPLISGIISGIIGGVVVGWLSKSQTSVSGPAAGLSTLVAAQIQELGSLETFLLAVIVAGIVQIVLGIVKAGALSAFFPSAVIKGLLAAIGVILILKQIPHLLGHDNDPEGDFAFVQKDHENTFSEIFKLFRGDFHDGALIVGLISLVFLIAWDRIPKLKKSLVPSSLMVVLLGLVLAEILRTVGGKFAIDQSHLVDVPIASDWAAFRSFFRTPDWSQILNSSVYLAGVTIAIVASLETLLNLEAVDKLDPMKRRSPPNRELFAQGVGNILCGLVGGIPVTSVVVRSSVNLNAGARTKVSAIVHGVLIALAVIAIPTLLNRIPLACLAAILIVTGFKLANWKLFSQMLNEGRYQAIPFFVTLLAIVFSDLLIGIGIGLTISLAFILYSSLSSPVRRVLEKQTEGNVLHIQLASQVSFLNRAALEDVLYNADEGTHVLINATGTEYIDPDIIALIRDFRDTTAAVRGVTVSTKGFRSKFGLENQINYPQITTQELQKRLAPSDVLDVLKSGNERFRSGNRLTRDLGLQLAGASQGQHPLAVILSCIDSRSPAEIIFDLGIGDIFTVRIAGNVVREKVIGSIEYACAVAGAKLIVVLGHTQCGAVNSTIKFVSERKSALEVTGCQNLDILVREIQKSVDVPKCLRLNLMTQQEKDAFLVEVTRENVLNSMRLIQEGSGRLRELIHSGQIQLVGAIYDIASGEVQFLEEA
ncbi:Bicarbonate transporter BicA [Pirellula sp. SH-Sr6A]|uniref:bifunctional SulP family inorganic anion transporter/carbonic anhydrase n=1 Tax=Pirellula sp. SH-Sr6A TaxID=1632865 RepID=UPI00078EBACB|nr:SulP family inorganic anion transporter [Pirellula sp. SH-Sr6A]AMV31013.1 Bicarbonate transporter BicA [Pirellula sp. SH-Sr6A]